jgi:tRNA pseudouridine32 synthase/23S rRNA pseudouridine746 synthase
VHATARYAVVHKPPGLLSVPGKGPDKQDCAAARVAALFPHASGPLVVHRLDMETSGLMVFALDPDAQRDLSAQFERRQVHKAYTALLSSPVALSGPSLPGGIAPPRQTPQSLPDSGRIDLPIRADIHNRPYQVIDFDRGRPAITDWQLLAREIDRVRIRLLPLTGRTHQLRLHAAAGLGLPIIGDALYAGQPAERLMLHASELGFLEPGTPRRVDFTSQAPF